MLFAIEALLEKHDFRPNAGNLQRIVATTHRKEDLSNGTRNYALTEAMSSFIQSSVKFPDFPGSYTFAKQRIAGTYKLGYFTTLTGDRDRGKRKTF